MKNFKRFVLKNGLRVIVHEDNSTPLVSCNVVYNVGSKDENPDFTGMAHLFEHFMFTGSKNVPDYDYYMQKIGAINNAYTTQDVTHYYSVAPANNFEIPLWLESDRMLELAFDEQQLEIQKHVVSEEFKENFLNVPFGDMWMIFNDFVFEKCPYKWLTIGKSLEHIAKVDMDLMKDFFYRFYRPNNAVLVVAGNITSDTVMPKVEKWFSDIPSAEAKSVDYQQDDEQNGERYLEVERDVPYGMIVKGWKCPGRLEPDFYALDLLSDLFGSGHSSYFYKKFVMEEKLFVDLTAYITGTTLVNTYMVVGRPADGVSLEEADKRLSDFIYNFNFGHECEKDLQKVKNKAETMILSNEIRIDDRASAFGLAEIYSCVEDFQDEMKKYFDVDIVDLQHIMNTMLIKEKSNTLFYKAKR